MNRIILVGNVGRNPEQSKSGEVVKFSLATTDRKETQWHRIVCFGKTAQFAQSYITKGACVGVEGRLVYRESEVKGEKRVTAEVYADSLNFCGSRQQQQTAAQDVKQIKEAGIEQILDDEDIPY